MSPRLRSTPNGPDGHATSVGAVPRPDVVNLVDRLRRLHSPTVVCRGCCSADCGGDCEYGDDYGGELMTVCSHCCFDVVEGKQNWVCLDDHDHGAESGPSAICATSAVLDAEMCR